MEIQNKEPHRPNPDAIGVKVKMKETQGGELHRITSTAIIRKDGKYLILKRSLNKKAFPGRWTLPGGGLTVEDYINTPKTTADAWYFSASKALKREVMEEAGIEVDKFNYLLDLTFIRSDGVPVITLSYYGDWKSGDVKINEESMDYKWVSAEEAKEYDLIEGLLEEIEIADRILRGEDPSKGEIKLK
ncbi:MAG: NUDIX domain-containing protein [Candidatus Nealsonbacteria bacterium]|nr:NUDIX domain-containing protein [Candidatus Nealsonbacteria bacterium]